jgi:ribosomal-protein-alanine N-acetyltransferase
VTAAKADPAGLKLSWATLADADRLALAHAGGFPRPWERADFEALFAGPGVFGFLALDADVPVGMVLMRIAAAEAEVLTLAVAPHLRRRGVGAALMTAALEAAGQSGAKAAFLEVGADNPGARRLYEALGFTAAGVRPGYYDRGPDGRVDACVMRLDLAAAAP